MKILLDTHIWIWSIDEPERLGRHLRSELRNSENELWLSPISTWEATILHEKGRIELEEDLESWVAQATAIFREAPFTHEIVLESRRISFPHRDPADRFLAATAKVVGLTLATADAKLLGLGDIATPANR